MKQKAGFHILKCLYYSGENELCHQSEEKQMPTFLILKLNKHLSYEKCASNSEI